MGFNTVRCSVAFFITLLSKPPLSVKFRDNRDSNPGPLDVKRERYHLCYASVPFHTYIQFELYKFRNIVSFGRLVLFYFMQKRPERHLLLLLGTEEGGKNVNDGIRISGKKTGNKWIFGKS